MSSLLPDRGAKLTSVLYLASSLLLCGGTLIWGCYDAKSPNLPPCPDGGAGYTDPAGCFERIRHDLLDGGHDAR